MSKSKASVLVDLENIVGHLRNQGLPYECQGNALMDFILAMEDELSETLDLTASDYLQKTFYGNMFAGRVRPNVGELALGRGYQTIHSPFSTEKRGSITDGILIADAIEIVAQTHAEKPSHLVLVSGDIDIIWPVLYKARKYQVEVIVASFRATLSSKLIPYIGEENIIYLDDLANLLAYENMLQDTNNVFTQLQLHHYPKNGNGNGNGTHHLNATVLSSDAKPFKLAPTTLEQVMEHVKDFITKKTMTKRQLEIDLSDMFMHRPPNFADQVYNFLLREKHIEIIEDNVHVLS